MAEPASFTAAHDHRYVVVDIETTGLSPYHDSIIEVTALHLTNGEVTASFHALVDPGTMLPAHISTLTGITQHDLTGQPRFSDVGDELLAFLGDRVFVAHNANFDYNFLRQAYRRLQRDYRAPTLCTMLIGRALFHRRRASLDSMLAHAGIEHDRRHRGMADARATAQLFLSLAQEAAKEGMSRYTDLVARLPGRSNRERTADPALARTLPSAPGVYLMRDGNGQIVYIGKAKDIRRRVQTHFRVSDDSQPRLKRTLPQVTQVDCVQTGSELEALLLESRLIKQYLPAANIALRDYQRYPFIRLDLAEPFPRATLTRYPVADEAVYYGPFNRSGPAHTAVELIQDVFKLARCTGPIVPGVTQPCLYGQIGRCTRPCTGDVDHAAYQVQVEQAQGFLSGMDRSALTDLEQRRNALAEELRFEEAAELRDRIAELDYVFGIQQRLNFAVSEHHLIVVAPSVEAGCVELFCIRAGRLALQSRWTVGATDVSALALMLGDVYSSTPLDALIGKEQVDEVHIINAWLRQNHERHRTISISASLCDPESIAAHVAAAATDVLTEATLASAS